MKKIWKFPLEGSRVTVRMPEGAIPSHVDYDARTDCVAIWAEVDTDAPLEPRNFLILATGEEIPQITYTEKVKVEIMGQKDPMWIDGAEKTGSPLYIGTAIVPANRALLAGMPTVWHVFEARR